MATRVLIADDHRILREGLRSLIERRGNMEIVGEAGNGREALRLASETKPDLVVMDVSMPDLNGIEAARALLARVPRARIIALSMHSDRRLVGEMLRAGASAYVLKECAFDEFAGAVSTVLAGGTYLSPRIVGVLVDDYVQGPRARPPVLTPREREVLQLLAEGASTKRVAGDLCVSVKTVETHRRQIMDKLKMYSVAELTRYAIQEGLTSLER